MRLAIVLAIVSNSNSTNNNVGTTNDANNNITIKR